MVEIRISELKKWKETLKIWKILRNPVIDKD